MYISQKILDMLEKNTREAYKLICNDRECKRLSKREWLINFFSDKNATIIDVGCCGHSMNIDTQMKKGRWLHGELDSVTNKNYGVDINDAACKYLKNRYGRNDIIAADIVNDAELIKDFVGGHGDYILLADVIEHTNDPINFMKAIGKNQLASKIVITVPNAFHFVNWWFAKKNIEVINSDHKFWFTPFTLIKCCNEAGIIVEEIDFCGFTVHGKKLPKILCQNVMGSTICLVGKWSI